MALDQEVDQHELQQSIERCEKLYQDSVTANDRRTALATLRTIDKLQEKKTRRQKIADHDSLAAELDRVRGHLLPLNLAPADHPISEHARVAAEQLIRR